MKTKSPSRNAFSLVELLVVVALMGVLLSLGVTSIQSVASAGKVSSAGSSVMGLLEAARENAILKRQPTAVVMLLNGGDSARRAFSAFEHQTNKTWKQVSRWETLPEGIVVDDQADTNNLAAAFSTPTSPTLDSALPPITYRGGTYQPRSGYAYLIFLADGSLYQSGNCALKLVEGSVNGTTVQRKNGSTKDLQVLINDATGRSRVLRP